MQSTAQIVSITKANAATAIEPHVAVATVWLILYLLIVTAAVIKPAVLELASLF